MNSFSSLQAGCCPYHTASCQLPAMSLPPYLSTVLMDLYGHHVALRALQHSPHRPTRPSAMPVHSTVPLGVGLRCRTLCTENLHSVTASPWNAEQQTSANRCGSLTGPCARGVCPVWYCCGVQLLWVVGSHGTSTGH